MGLETATTIEELNDTWPLGSDNRSQGDDHIRLIKSVLKAELASGRIGGGKGATGEVFYFAGANPPDGALTCDGQEVSKTTYAELYAAIGDEWATTDGVAAPGAGNFRLPPRTIDGHFAFPAAVASGNVGTAYAARIGQHNHTMNHDHPSATTSTNGDHTHDIQQAGSDAAGNYVEDSSAYIDYRWQSGNISTEGAHNHTFNVPNYTGNTGNTGTASDNRPPSIGLLMCIWHGEVS